MIIERPKDTDRIKNLKKWVLIYGRRKTGKTFIVNNFMKTDEYFFVKTNRNILTKEGTSISYETFMEILKRSLDAGKTVAVDEFHRLGDDFFDFLHFTKKQGRLILVSSTLFLSKRLVSGKSPLLGLFAEVPVGLISLKDTLGALGKYGASKKERLELAILLREPIAVEYFDEKMKAREIIAQIIASSARAIPALVGEIFVEEERDISAIYEGVLRGIAAGKVNSGELASHLFSKHLIKKDDPSIIQQYLGNLVSFGIIRRIDIFNKKRFAYKIASPLARIYYYADEKYNLSERAAAPREELERIIDDIIPRVVEDAVREFLSEKYGLRESVVEAKDYDVDGCLLRFKKTEIALEVKWKKLDKKDIERSVDNLSKLQSAQKILFVQDKRDIKDHISVQTKNNLGLEVFDVDDLIGD